MPDFWSHRLAAKMAYDAIKDMHPFNETEYKYYMLGAQGPDLFYYLNKTHLFSKIHYKTLGSALHTQEVKEVFLRMTNHPLIQGHSELFAYTLGFYTHYQMDSHCHPSICAWGPDSKSHKVVEMALDAYTIFHYKGYPISKESLFNLHPDANDITQAFGTFISETLGAPDVSAKTLRRINKDFSRVQWILCHDVVGKLPFRNWIAQKLGYDLRGIRYESNLKAIENQWDTALYLKAFEAGVSEAKEGLLRLAEALDKKETCASFLEKTITLDYLGDPL